MKITLPDGTVVNEADGVTQEDLLAKYPQHILTGGKAAPFEAAVAARGKEVSGYQEKLLGKRRAARSALETSAKSSATTTMAV